MPLSPNRIATPKPIQLIKKGKYLTEKRDGKAGKRKPVPRGYIGSVVILGHPHYPFGKRRIKDQYHPITQFFHDIRVWDRPGI
jgi:hypothetical protein